MYPLTIVTTITEEFNKKIKADILQRLVVFLVCITIIIGTCISFAEAITPGERPYAMVTENYTVQTGDTLDKICKLYMKKNTWGKREFSEFKFGIQELNPQLFERDVIQGETLVINYWIENKAEEAG